jgi:recombination protein RecA
MSREALAKALDKAIGNGRQVEEPLVYLDTGYPPLNHIISGRYNGGLPAGRIYEISGGSSTGKTALATKLMVEAQAKGGFAIFCDWEKSFSIELAKQFGLNVDPGYFSWFAPATWEEGNSKAMQIAAMVRDSNAIEENAPIVVILDSIAAAVPRSQLEDKDGNERGIDEYTMNDTTALARVTSTTLKVIKTLADRHRVTLVYLNQTRTKPGVAYGDPTTTPGGVAMEFYADARLRLTRSQMKDKEKNFIGQEITAKAIKSKFTAPFKECSLNLMFNGEAAYFDVETSLVEHLCEIGVLKKEKGYIHLPSGDKVTVKDFAQKARDSGQYDKLVAMLPKAA